MEKYGVDKSSEMEKTAKKKEKKKTENFIEEAWKEVKKKENLKK